MLLRVRLLTGKYGGSKYETGGIFALIKFDLFFKQNVCGSPYKTLTTEGVLYVH